MRVGSEILIMLISRALINIPVVMASMAPHFSLGEEIMFKDFSIIRFLVPVHFSMNTTATFTLLRIV
jgi:hypothetical protein